MGALSGASATSFSQRRPRVKSPLELGRRLLQLGRRRIETADLPATEGYGSRLAAGSRLRFGSFRGATERPRYAPGPPACVKQVGIGDAKQGLQQWAFGREHPRHE